MVTNPRQEFQTRLTDQFSAELYKKAYERVVKEIVDQRERIAKKSVIRSKNQRGALETSA